MIEERVASFDGECHRIAIFPFEQARQEHAADLLHSPCVLIKRQDLLQNGRCIAAQLLTEANQGIWFTPCPITLDHRRDLLPKSGIAIPYQGTSEMMGQA